MAARRAATWRAAPETSGVTDSGLLYRLHRWVDPSLNYGRDVVTDLVRRCEGANSVLDIGAGGGGDLLNARAVAPAARLVAFDFLPESLQRLASLGVEAHRVDIERDRFPLADESIDVIIANQVLEHSKEIFWVFHEMTRSLALGGHLVLGVPNLASLHNRLLLAAGRQPTCIRSASAHVRGFTKADLLDFTQSCFPGGFHLVHYAGSNFYPFPAGLAKPLARALPSLAVAHFFLLRKSLPYGSQFLDFPAAQQLETNFFRGPAA
jgi:SAM-dependent methyltransferase